MKKFSLAILILSILGITASIILLIQHVDPSTGYKLVSCGTGSNNPCMTVSQSAYSKFIGVSLPSWGIFFYLTILFISILSITLKDSLKKSAFSLLFPLSIAGVIVDIILFSILISMKQYCNMCIVTYIINLLILVGVIIWSVSLKSEKSSAIKEFKNALNYLFNKVNRKSLVSLMGIIIMLFISVIIVDTSLSSKKGRKGHHGHNHPPFDADAAISNFYAKTKEPIQFPDTILTSGNPDAPVKMHIFTDFLCPACNKFKMNLDKAIKTYKDKVYMVFYHYPLDAECNTFMTRTLHPGACKLHRAFYAAAKLGKLDEIFKSNLVQFMKYYRKLQSDYTDYFIDEYLQTSSLSTADQQKFKIIMKQNPASNSITKDLNLGKQINIRSTPTIFINYRRVVGAMHTEYIKAVIKNEIEGKGQY